MVLLWRVWVLSIFCVPLLRGKWSGRVRITQATTLVTKKKRGYKTNQQSDRAACYCCSAFLSCANCPLHHACNPKDTEAKKLPHKQAEYNASALSCSLGMDEFRKSECPQTQDPGFTQKCAKIAQKQKRSSHMITWGAGVISKLNSS